MTGLEGDVNTITRDIASAGAKLHGFRATTKSTTSALRLDVNDIRGRLIPELRHDLHNEIHKSARDLTAAVDKIGATVQAVLDRLSAHSDTRAETSATSTQAEPSNTTDAVDSPVGHSDDGPGDANPREDDDRRDANPRGDLRSPPQRQHHDFRSAAFGSRVQGTSDHSRVNFQLVAQRGADPWYSGGARAHTVTPGASFRSNQSRPSTIDTAATTDASLGGLKGGPIISPRASDRERLARSLKISRYDLATLAHSNYHGGLHGVPELTINFIH